MPTYETDSCLEKLRLKPHNICCRPAYNTVCYKPIVDRSILKHTDYLKLLSTPKGYKWTGMTSYFKKLGKNAVNKYSGGANKSNKYNKPYTLKNYGRNIYEKNQYNKPNQKNFSKYSGCVNEPQTSKHYRKNTFEKNQHTKRGHKRFNNKLDETKILQDKLTNNAHRDDITNRSNSTRNRINLNDLNNNNNDDVMVESDEVSDGTSRIIKKQEEEDDILKKKQLWLHSEKKRQQKEEKENKFKNSLHAKQKAYERHKKKVEERNKMKKKRKEMFEEERRRKKFEKEKEGMAKKKAMAEIELLKERARLRNETEKECRLKLLRLEEMRIVKEEKEWRNKINQEYAEKMAYTIDPKNEILSMIPNILNNKNEHEMGKTGMNRLIQLTKNVLAKVESKNGVFDPGNLMKQIINKELDATRQVKLKKQLEINNDPLNECNKISIHEKVQDKKDKDNSEKSLVFKNHYGLVNKIDSQNLDNTASAKSFDKQCVPKNHKNELKCKAALDEHCYSNTSFNYIVCHWKNEVADVISNMQKRRRKFLQNAIAHKTWEN